MSLSPRPERFTRRILSRAIVGASFIAYAMRLAPRMKRDQILLVNLSGRGDKDMHTVAKASGLKF